MLFVALNLLIGGLVLTGMALDYAADPLNINGVNNSDDITYGNIDDIGDYRPSETDMQNANIPQWFITLLLLFDGVWFGFIVIGWIRGQH